MSKMILKTGLFDEVTNPTALFINDNIIAITDSYHGQYPARDVSLYQIAVTLYDRHTLQFINQFNQSYYPINDIAFHPTKPELLIANGSYDGGWFFEGELIVWDYLRNQHRSVLTDSREVLRCHYVGDKIEFEVSPADDSEEGGELYRNEVYQLSQSSVLPVSLSQCQLMSSAPVTFEHYEPVDANSLMVRINNSVKAEQKHYQPRAMARDLVFIDSQTLCVGLSHGTIEIWHIDQQTNLQNINQQPFEKIQLAEEGECAQLFWDEVNKLITVNVFVNQRVSPFQTFTITYQIDYLTRQVTQVFSGAYVLSRNAQGYYLARHFVDRDQPEIGFDAHFNQLWSKPLGHYDIFNHYIRVDNAPSLFALVGTPNDQHKHKQLIELDPLTGEISDHLVIDPPTGHYMNLNGILLETIILMQAKVYNPNPKEGKFTLFALDKTSKSKLWQREIAGQVTAFCQGIVPSQVIASLTTGDIQIIDGLNGQLLQSLTYQYQRAKPLSLARLGRQLAIGFTDGVIELLEL